MFSCKFCKKNLSMPFYTFGGCLWPLLQNSPSSLIVRHAYTSDYDNDFNEAVFTWFQNIRMNNIAVNSNAIKEKILPSDGWLENSNKF